MSVLFWRHGNGEFAAVDGIYAGPRGRPVFGQRVNSPVAPFFSLGLYKGGKPAAEAAGPRAFMNKFAGIAAVRAHA